LHATPDTGRYLMKTKTKSIFILVTIIFILFLSGKEWLPSILNHIYSQWLLIALLVVLTSIGFVKSFSSLYSTTNCNYRKILEPLYFLFIFCSVIAFLGVTHLTILSIYDLNSFSVSYEIKKLECLSCEKCTESTRKKMAQVLYWHFGQKLPYLKKSGKYEIFNPSDNDIQKANESQAKRTEIRKIIDSAAESSKKALIIQLLAIAGFFIITSIGIFVELHNFIIKKRHTNR
jgi:uncharacterized membrane protein